MSENELPDPVTASGYAIEVVTNHLHEIADQAGMQLGDGTGQIDATIWAAALVDRLVAHGLVLPVDWVGRPPGAPFHSQWPLPAGEEG
jgi:hypothetical protein